MTQGRLSWGYWVDYDNDGFLDLLVTAGNAVNEVNYLYHNRLPSTGNRNNWLKVRLVGKASNSMGVGAKLRVTSVIEGSSVQQLRQMMAPLLGDHQAFTAHFGLGDATKVDTFWFRSSWQRPGSSWYGFVVARDVGTRRFADDRTTGPQDNGTIGLHVPIERIRLPRACEVRSWPETDRGWVR